MGFHKPPFTSQNHLHMHLAYLPNERRSKGKSTFGSIFEPTAVLLKKLQNK